MLAAGTEVFVRLLHKQMMVWQHVELTQRVRADSRQRLAVKYCQSSMLPCFLDRLDLR